MNPRWIEEMSYAMGEVYEAVVDRILINLAKHFPYIHSGSEPKDLFQYQARMLAQMGQVNQETIDIIVGSLDGADEALREMLKASITEALRTEEPALRKAAENGFLSGVPPEVSPNQMQAFRNFYQQSADKLNLVNTVMLESTQEVYLATVTDIVDKALVLGQISETQNILNVATGEVVSGASTLNEAVRDAVEKMLKTGITGFIDHGDHHWSPEAYVTMDVRTTMANTARAAVWERQDEYRSDLYQISWHDGARPKCYPWQGKIVSRTGRSGTTQDENGNTIRVYSESEIPEFGYGGSVFGVNCGHYPIPFVPNFSRIREPKQDEETNDVEYEQSQQQRALERQLRAERRDLQVAKERNDPVMIEKYQARVEKAEDDLDNFCDETGRKRRRNREYTPIRPTFPDV